MAKRSVLVPAAVALLILIWGTTWAAIRLGLGGIPPFSGVAIRFALAGALLLVYGIATGVPRQRSPAVYKIWIVQTLFAFCLSYGVVYWAEQWISSGLAAIIFSTLPLFVAVLAHFLLPDEPMRLAQLVGIALGFAGVAVIFSDDLTIGDEQALTAATLLLVSPIAASIAHVLIKKWGRGIHPVNIVAVPMMATGVIMGALAVAVERGRSWSLDVVSVGALLYLTVAGSAVTFSIYYWVLERVAATRLALITFGIPVVAVGVGIAFLGEPFGLATALGSVLVLGGVFLALRS